MTALDGVTQKGVYVAGVAVFPMQGKLLALP